MGYPILFLLGTLSSLLFHHLPSLSLLLFCFVAVLFIFYFARSLIILKYFCIFCLGWCWIMLYATIVLAWSLPISLEEKPIHVVGYIASLPYTQNNRSAFDFKLQEIENDHENVKIHLSWRGRGKNLPALSVGDQWHFLVKLKRPHGLMNPGGFDSEKLLFQNHIRATGYVVAGSENYLLKSSFWNYPIQRARQQLQNKIYNALNGSSLSGIILALTMGFTAFISKEQWQVFRATGTNHLVAISGLHIGLVAELVARLVNFLWCRIPYLSLRVSALQASSIAGLTAGLFYSTLAGFSVSTQRSLIMIGAVMITRLCRRQIAPSRSLLLALSFILIINPLAILVTGFWLSFVAVACLFYGMQHRLASKGLWWKWGRAQWVVGIGMVPVSLFIFQQTSLISMIANVIAIPWISFLVVPTCLLGALLLLISNKLGGLLLFLSEKALAVIWAFLCWIASFSHVVWRQGMAGFWVAMSSHIAVFITLLPYGLPLRWLASLWMLPTFFYHPGDLQPNQVKLTVFDVGQGLATMVQTQHHHLIYDTGAKITDNFDMGQVVIIPYLLHNGIKRIDALVISHGDNDHIGGAAAILREMNVHEIITSVPSRFPQKQAKFCWNGLQWRWDGVHFKFLHPERNFHGHGNNTSCVLKITIGNKSILLTGDIEKKIENELLQKAKRELPTTLLVIPHHGSHTSSSWNFIQEVHAQYAIFSYGYRNRYHHPHREVCQRYARVGTKTLNTVLSGAITMTLDANSDIVHIHEFRKEYRKFWHID
jgi:competence protein ComEC